MTISCNLFVDRSQQVEVFDDGSGTQVEVALYQFCDLIIGDFACTECIYQNGNGFCNADSVSQLYFTFACNAACNNVLCNVSCCVACGTVYLCGVFAAECAAAVGSVTAVGVNDDLSACQAAVALRAADNESACGVDVVFCLQRVR